MEITFNFLKTKEVVNIYDGKRLGHIIDVTFEKESGRVLGFVVPGIKKVFKRTEDIFIPLELVRKIGEDVILVKLAPIEEEPKHRKVSEEELRQTKTYARYKRVPKQE